MASIALGSYFEDFLRHQVDSGRFNNASEVVRAGLRLLEENGMQYQLRNVIQQGLSSGLDLDVDAVFDRLEKKYSELCS